MTNNRTALFGVLILVLVGSGSPFFFGSEPNESPEDAAMHRIMNAPVWTSGTVVEIFMERLTPEPWQLEYILDEMFTAMDLANDSSPDCNACVENAALLLALVQIGFTYEDLYDAVHELCLNATAEVGLDGDLICEGTLNNYGPHLHYVLNTTNKNAEQICVTINTCMPNDVLPVTPSKIPTPRRPAGPRRNVTLDDAIKVLHVTDLHIEEEYDTGSATVCSMPMCCRDEWPGSGYAGMWGAYGCNIPPRTTDVLFDFLASMNPAFVFYTGDSPASTAWLETQEGQIRQSRIIADKIATHFPGIPAFTSIGNHESYPGNLYYTPRPEIQELNRELALMWQSLSGFQQEQLDTMQNGGYYSVLIQPGLRLLNYNSNYGYTWNFYVILDEEDAGYTDMKQFMEDTFNNARVNGEKVVVLGHHLSTESRGTTREYSDSMTDIFRRNADLVVVHLVGHTHRDMFKMNTDPDTGDVYNVEMSLASMTSSPKINPTGRILYLHPDTLDLLDMDTFSLNLQNPVNNGSNPVVELSYRATAEYNMVDFTPESVNDFVNRMEVDDELFNKYRHNIYTKTGAEEPCDAECKAREMCIFRSTSLTQEEACMDRIQ